jgi:hypothetical protein
MVVVVVVVSIGRGEGVQDIGIRKTGELSVYHNVGHLLKHPRRMQYFPIHPPAYIFHPMASVPTRKWCDKTNPNGQWPRFYSVYCIQSDVGLG